MSDKDYQNFCEQVLEWQGHPVTEMLRDLLSQQIQARKSSLQARWWAGQEISEGDRLSVARLEEWHEDFFSASPDDVRAAMERENDDE